MFPKQLRESMWLSAAVGSAIIIGFLVTINFIKAGTCPSCGLPTFYGPAKKSHVCQLCGRVYRIGEHGETKMAKRLRGESHN